MKMKWKERIQRLIRAVGSPEAAAVEMGCSLATIIRWRDGDTEPRSRLVVNRLEMIEKGRQQTV